MVYIAALILIFLITIIGFVMLEVYKKYRKRISKSQIHIFLGCTALIFLVACGKNFSKDATNTSISLAKECIINLNNDAEKRKLMDELKLSKKEKKVNEIVKTCLTLNTRQADSPSFGDI